MNTVFLFFCCACPVHWLFFCFVAFPCYSVVFHCLFSSNTKQSKHKRRGRTRPHSLAFSLSTYLYTTRHSVRGGCRGVSEPLGFPTQIKVGSRKAALFFLLFLFLFLFCFVFVLFLYKKQKNSNSNNTQGAATRWCKNLSRGRQIYI